MSPGQDNFWTSGEPGSDYLVHCTWFIVPGPCGVQLKHHGIQNAPPPSIVVRPDSARASDKARAKAVPGGAAWAELCGYPAFWVGFALATGNPGDCAEQRSAQGGLAEALTAQSLTALRTTCIRLPNPC